MPVFSSARSAARRLAATLFTATLLTGSLLVGGALLGCGGADSATTRPAEASAQAEPSPAAADEAERRRKALAALEARQRAVCDASAKPIFDCAVEDARATLSPEEFAALDPAQLEAEHRRVYTRDCAATDMSLRQIEVYERCASDTRCEVYLPCLDQAKPEASQ
ncbi:MAG: hypothetical protein Tsb0020_30350 [Haliangiales bacterium]